MNNIPVYDGDLFSEQGILDPYPHYKAIRDLGPVVHLSAGDVPTVSRYDSVPVPKDTRLLILYGAANRDERKWDDADKFDIQRSDVRKHMAFGFGIHQCAGQHLTRLEMTCLLNAMVTRVKRIEATNSEYVVNSALRVLSKLDTTFH